MNKKDLGSRRIQCVGRGSYIVSLPKDWVLESKLAKGSEITFNVLDDGSALLVPRKFDDSVSLNKANTKEYCVRVRYEDDTSSLCRKITSLYAVGADMIRLKFENEECFKKHRKSVNELTKVELLGAEIIDECESEIIIQILVNHPNLSVEAAIKRMAILALEANKEAILSLKNENVNFIQNITNFNSDIKRLDLYVIRQLKYHLERNSYKDLGFKSKKEFLGYRIVINDIRNISNNALNVAKNVASVMKFDKKGSSYSEIDIDKEIYSQITSFCFSMHKMFDLTLKAMFIGDYREADKIFSQLDECAASERKIALALFGKRMDPKVTLVLGLMLDASRRIMEYCQNIAEITLNRTVETTLPATSMN
ncbi:MAG: phosphate uptake regulator PhoU [Methanomassiliicoccales archaeon]